MTFQGSNNYVNNKLDKNNVGIASRNIVYIWNWRSKSQRKLKKVVLKKECWKITNITTNLYAFGDVQVYIYNKIANKFIRILKSKGSLS